MVRIITDPEFLRKNDCCGVGGCQDVVSYELDDRVDGLWGHCCQPHATLHNLGVNVKELHEEAMKKLALPPSPAFDRFPPPVA
jgi:hypothetical protein